MAYEWQYVKTLPDVLLEYKLESTYGGCADPFVDEEALTELMGCYPECGACGECVVYSFKMLEEARTKQVLFQQWLDERTTPEDKAVCLLMAVTAHELYQDEIGYEECPEGWAIHDPYAGP